jgi:hypothetical protein
MRPGAVPWLLALAGLGFSLVQSQFEAWPNVAAWLVTLVLAWLLVRGYREPLTRAVRVALAIVLLPILVLTTPGGLWLVPADLAWLVLEIADPLVRRTPHQNDLARPGR